MCAARVHSLASCLAFILVWGFALVQPAPGAIIRVPQDYPTINEAIGWAWDGDEIVVSTGTYTENISFRGRNFVLCSTDPMSSRVVGTTIIQGTGGAVTFLGTETSSAVLAGFTIRGNGTGYGINGNGATARIEYNLITGHGCGVGFHNGPIRNNVIGGNSATGGLDRCDGVIENNMISENYNGGLSACNGLIQNNVIVKNWAPWKPGGGLAYCNGTLRNNTIAQNTSAQTSGGGLAYCTGTIVNCIIWENSAPVGPQMIGSSTPTYSSIMGGSGGLGNIALGPRFRSPNDFRLQSSSPCIDAGTTTNCPATDYAGNPRPYDGNNDGQAGCDMGAYEYIISSPASPLLYAEPLFTSGTTNQVAWSAVPGAVGYYCECDEVPSFMSPRSSGWIAATQWTAMGLTNGATYYYRVRCRNALLVSSSLSNGTSSRQDATPPTAPGTPADAGSYTSSTTVRFNWTVATDAISGVGAYELQAGTAPGASNVFNGNVGNVLTRTVTGANGQSVYARVRARDAVANAGPWSGNSDGIAVDTVRPRLSNLVVQDYRTLVATFNEPVNNANQAMSYTGSNGLRILGAVAVSGVQYTLTTSDQRSGTSYTLMVGNPIGDRAGNPIDPLFRARWFRGVAKAQARSWQLYR